MTEKVDEIEALKSISDTLNRLNDKAAAERLVRWAWDKYVGDTAVSRPAATLKKAARAKPKPKGTSKPKKKEALTLVKDLNLNPKDSLSLAEFVGQKQPSSMKAKIAVCAYYLANHVDAGSVSINHVYTSFKWLKWRLPADLKNMIHQTGSAGWLDSSDLENLQLTTMGENFVEHDLPKSSKSQ
ncbi:MAG: hypothetical protein OER22_00230 [Gammaproteobacteria bacterium]|nr:hypothetical protein [Gammaproteobacteria bacterium]MDH3372095.1 hypothetical protein [Gammaproteobacteria bacterium]MDH3408414.1 hypothetical protein [Gammaproteobacteria bacterium]MDH3551020.1 hypothetical protein [Gammaproteobacteria bacterium]